MGQARWQIVHAAVGIGPDLANNLAFRFCPRYNMPVPPSLLTVSLPAFLPFLLGFGLLDDDDKSLDNGFGLLDDDDKSADNGETETLEKHPPCSIKGLGRLKKLDAPVPKFVLPRG